MAKLWCDSGLIRRFPTNFGAGSCGPPLVFAEALKKWLAVTVLTRYMRKTLCFMFFFARYSWCGGSQFEDM